MCGPEIGVGSTKAYTSQIVAITLMALKLGEDKISTLQRRHEIVDSLKQLPQMISKALSKEDEVKEIARSVSDKHSMLVMGRGYQYSTCLEGALVPKPGALSNLDQENQGNLLPSLRRSALRRIETRAIGTCR
jgi:glucosamine--fructose-6-phosphate aminotransferase (isomerizing)